MPAGNPLANLLVIVVGVLTIAVSIVVGFFAFVALAGFLLVVVTVVGVRSWWLKRQIKSAANYDIGENPPTERPAAVIEGEFKVVDGQKRPDHKA